MQPLPRPSLAFLVPFCLGVCGLFFGYANPAYHFPPLSLLTPAALLWLGLEATGRGQAFRHGFLLGAAGSSLALYWVAIPVHDYGNAPWILATPCPMLLGSYMGLYPGLFALAVHLAGPRLTPWSGSLFAASVWALLELFRGWLFTGFPWLVLPQAFASWPWAIQSLPLIGGSGLSALLVGVTALATYAVRQTRWKRTLWSVSLSLLLLLSVYGIFALYYRPVSSPEIIVSIAQGNIDQGQKWDPSFQEKTVRRYMELSRNEALQHKPALIVWPETSMPFFFQERTPLSGLVRSLVQELATPLLAGAPGYEQDPTRSAHIYYNRAYLLATNGSIAGIYEKEHLVPFGEYVPLATLFPFLTRLVEGIGDFLPGQHTGPLTIDNLALGVLICYEAIFPELAQKRVREGATILVNISNDAWYGRSSAALQHLHLSLLRAVEQDRYLVRATNTGISAIVDPRGRVLARTELFEKTSIRHEVSGNSGITLYHKLHGLMVPLLATLAVMAFIPGAWRRRRAALGSTRP